VGTSSPPPSPALAGQNRMFSNLFVGNSIFLVFFRQIVWFGPPWKILPSPGKKSADADDDSCDLIQWNQLNIITLGKINH